ncbi:MAG: metallophosphoesterase [Planctomycetaceae bacterium]
MNRLNLLILAILAAGHCELLAALLNRLHARRIQARWLRHIRHVEDACMAAFPFVVLWSIGLRGPRLLIDGSWSDLHPAWIAYLSLCAIGTVSLAVSTLRWWTRRPPPLLAENHSTTIDVAERLGRPPVGVGPFRFLTRLPGNESFLIEVSDKSYTLPRLPVEWDGLSILHVTDLHYNGTIDKAYFEEVFALAAEMPADLVVFTGDLLDEPHLAEWIPDTLGKLDAPLGKFFVLGNHDWYLDPAPIRRALDELGWIDVSSRTETIAHLGRTLAICGSERPWMGTQPDDLAAIGGDAFRLFLSHTPDNIGWAKRNGVDLMLSGHNHGGQVVLPILGPVFSPSKHGVRYAGGAFYEPPTLLYVSRGVSGDHPLRWNCKPELTRLILRAPTTTVFESQGVCDAARIIQGAATADVPSPPALRGRGLG